MDNETIRSTIFKHNICDGGLTLYVDDDAALETAMDALKQLGYITVKEPFDTFENPKAVNDWLGIIGSDWMHRDGDFAQWFDLRTNDEDCRNITFAVVSKYRDYYRGPKTDDGERHRAIRIFGRNEMRG